MKKIFYFAGFFTGIYLIYVFILFSNSIIFPTVSGELFDCSVEKNIRVKDLISISKQYDMTVFTNEYHNTAAFSKDIVFQFLSISQEHSSGIHMGFQPSLFPTNKILYEIQNQYDLCVQRFWVMQNNISNFKEFLGALKEYGVSADYFMLYTMNSQVVFAGKNIEFFVCMCLFLLFCMGSYYVIRNKEIAILKLYGCSNLAISGRLIKTAAFRILIGYIITCMVFCMYILMNNMSLLGDYLKLFFYVIFCIIYILAVSFFIGAVFVNCMSILPSIKNKKNNKLILSFTVVFKICITVILLLFAKSVYYEVLDLKTTTYYTNNSPEIGRAHV